MLHFLNKCYRCNKDVYEPKLLPCGFTICTFCEKEIKSIDHDYFDCSLCGKTHVKDNNDFPVIQVVKIINRFSIGSQNNRVGLKLVKNKVEI